ncbi:holin family protein [Alteromonas sp. LMIT006]|uniref:3TM-type holin n=1 Tax=Alteromonadaceae TaxID=72275 RepID=UPI0020CA5D80|nr:3TM-type holin [Alteromonas sp. LMIT006]UTP73018.1 holin family protein [Alteromonas sp. LMIT006]
MSVFKRIPVVTTLLDTLGKRIDDLFTSDEERGDIATQQQKIALKQLVTQLKAQHTQLQINLQQTKHPSLFVAGARPAIIWIGAAGLAYEAIVRPLGTWLILQTLDLNAIMGPQALQNATPQQVQAILDFYALPGMNTELFLPIIFGVLGIGGFRTWEKINGKARDNLTPQHGEYELMAKVMLEKYQTELDTPPSAFISNPSISQFKAAQKDGTFVPQYYQYQPNDRAKGN